MSIEALVLGLVSGLRPATSQAAVFALLRAPAARRSMLAFTVAGFAFSLAIGLLLSLAFDGAGGALGQSAFAAVFDLVAGVAALGFAVGVERGRVLRPRAAPAPQERPESRLRARLRRPTVVTAAAAGVATHVPGLIYIVALNAISAGDPGSAAIAFQVALYNLLWFAVPIAALALAIRSPRTAAMYLDRLTAWARGHQERLVIALFGALGVYLIVKGIVSLA